MATRRRVALYTAGSVLLILAVLAIAPSFLRGPVEARVKAAIGRKVAADVAWQDIGLSLFHDFPNLSLSLDRLSVTGIDRFRGDTLLAVPRFRLVLDLGSVLGSLRGSGPIVVRAIQVERPAVRLLVLKDGTANWNIMRPDTTSTSAGRPLDLSLKQLRIQDGALTFDNRQSGLLASINGLQETLSGDFRSTRFTLRTETGTAAVSLRFAGVPYLNGVRVQLTANLDMDMAGKRYTLKQNEVRLNDLVLSTTGTIAGAPDGDYALDLTFKAPRADFKEILSLVPAIYARDFAGVQASGTMSVAGWVRGRYGPKTFPALALDAKVENGTFRYPDLPLPARDIALDLSVSNPGGTVDATVVNLRHFHVVLGRNPLDGSFAMRTPVSDPDVDARVAGRVDLADVARTIKLPNVDQLTGVIDANAAMHARMSDVDQKRYDRIAASGTVSAHGIVLRGKQLPHPVQVDEATLKLAPQHAELSSFRGKIGRSDLAATGFLDNVLGFALRDQELRGQAQVTSGYFDMNEWRSNDKMQVIPVPKNLDFALNATVGRLSYGQLDLRNARGALRVKDQRVTLDNFQLDMLGGSLALTGFYETTNLARPTFDLSLKAANMDVPGAFNTIQTIQAFAPVAKYAQGRASADLQLKGALGQDLMPVFSALSGLGSIQTAGLVLKSFPPMTKLADLLKVDQLRDPGFVDLKALVEIRDGKLMVKPFDVHVGKLTMNVSGANGIDQTLQYLLKLELPRAALGAEANRAVNALVAKTAQAGLNLQAADVVNLGVLLGGTVTNPLLSTNLRQATTSAVQQVGEAVQKQVTARVDTAALQAKVRAQAEASRIVSDAEQRAAAMKAQARALADTLHAQAQARADSLTNKPTNPLARAAARLAAERVLKQADTQAQAMVRAADARADSLVAVARARAATVTGAPVAGPTVTGQ